VIGGVQVDLLVSPVDDLPRPGGASFVEELEMRAGGAGANVGFAFSEIGMPVRLIGCVGGDRLGEWMIERLEVVGLDTDILTVPGESTGLTVVFEGPKRDRTFITYLGVNADWDLSMIDRDALLVDNLLLCDYFCAPQLQGAAARELLGRARGAGATTFFDTAWDPGGWPESTRDELLELLGYVDVFLPNEAEARAITGLSGPIEESARLLQSASGGWVVVKLGARGCLAVGPGEVELRVAAPGIQAADSTGAGDAFNAGLIAALAEPRTWPEALRSATTLASTIVARPSGDRHPQGPRAPARDLASHHSQAQDASPRQG
jgi:sugar/nucleoside kinase (ribokinase family)